MKNSKKIRLLLSHELVMYGGAALLGLSGIAWLAGRYFVSQEPDSGALQLLSMKVHGAAAMLFLLMLGSMAGHVRLALQGTKNRASGIILLSMMGILVLSSWMLYYGSADLSREWVSALHWILGLVMLLGLGLHAILGRKSR